MAYTANRIYHMLLGGWDRSVSLTNAALAMDQQMADARSLGALIALLRFPAARTAIFDSDNAMQIIARSSTVLAEILNNDTNRVAMLGNATALAALAAQVNQAASFLKATAFTSSGTFSIPGTGLKALYVLAQGAGGNGANAASSVSGGGGSGGEMKGYQCPVASLPGSNVTVTLGTVGNPTTFGALVSAASGANGAATNGANATGGGSTTSGGAAAGLASNNIVTAPWHKITFSNQGGQGGAGRSGASSDGGAGGDGSAGGTGGAGGLNGSTSSAGPGTAYGAGGGGGGSNSGAGTPANGTAAAANSGAGGGGGQRFATTYGTGGAGGSAYVRAYYVQGR